MFIKYPRTSHLVGSRLQSDDTIDGQVPVETLTEGELIWEEKLDGANSGISFTDDCDLLLQSRGHPLTGGSREAQFNLFKQWASSYEVELYDILGNRYIMYGEWCYAKHTVYYDSLPHYFNEFDIYDKELDIWLDTKTRHKMLGGSLVVSVPVVHKGMVKGVKGINELIRPSLYKTENWRESLRSQATSHKIDPDQAVKETEKSDFAEGLYLKQEENGKVIGRYKFVRLDFLQTILDSGSHWATRTILPNVLAKDATIFGGSYA